MPSDDFSLLYGDDVTGARIEPRQRLGYIQRIAEVARMRRMADEMLAARELVAADPAEAANAARRLFAELEGRPYLTDAAERRLRINLADGIGSIKFDPMVLQGYLYGAAMLVRSLAWLAERDRFA
jgi:hypothetical protein